MHLESLRQVPRAGAIEFQAARFEDVYTHTYMQGTRGRVGNAPLNVRVSPESSLGILPTLHTLSDTATLGRPL